MDLGFFRRGLGSLASRSTERLDYDLLLASLHACQAQSATARAHARGTGCVQSAAATPLVEILAGGPGWRDAVTEQGGSFNLAFVGRGRLDA